jgi:hypothetical protein
MSDLIKNPTNRVDRAANGKFIAFWQGRVVYMTDGTVRHFTSEVDARAFLDQCDRAGGIIQ